MFSRYLSILAIVAGCGDSNVNRPRDGMLMFEDQDLSVPQPEPDLSASAGDMAMEEFDLSLLPEDLMASSRGDMAGAGGCNIKVNELLLSTFRGTTSRPSEEYVELYNPCASSKSLKGWSIRYRSSTNNTKASNPDTPLVQDIGKTIPAMGYLLYSGTQYSGTHDGVLLNGLSDDGGGVALVDNNNVIIDSVAYGPVDANHNFLEGTPAPLPPQTIQPGKVTARSPNGADTDDNGVDFKVQSPTPKAPNT
jgi:Lamin Tail Domain